MNRKNQLDNTNHPRTLCVVPGSLLHHAASSRWRKKYTTPLSSLLQCTIINRAHERAKSGKDSRIMADKRPLVLLCMPVSKQEENKP